MTDVIVVGGGPVGMVTALGLARAGVGVKLIEGHPRLSEAPRAAVYHWSVLDGFARLNVLSDLERVALKSSNYTYLVRQTGERIAYSLDALRNVTARPYNLHLGQHQLVKVVLHKLNELSNATVALNKKLVGLVQDAERVSATVEGEHGIEEIRAEWLVGADGAGSTVRKLLNLPFEGFTWPERFIATNLSFDFSQHGYTSATFIADRHTGAVVVPLNADRLWRYTYMEDAALPEEGFLERLPEVFAKLLPAGEPYVVEQASAYRMHQRSAPSYRVGRVLLAGDAAHSTNPTGGLGLTCGLFDSYALQELLPAVVLGAAHDDVLTRYSDVRREIFTRRASPQAVANKNFVFHADGGDAKWNETLANVRRMSFDDDYARSRLLFTKTLETPALLTGSAPR